jgi:hypothetical protein
VFLAADFRSRGQKIFFFLDLISSFIPFKQIYYTTAPYVPVGSIPASKRFISLLYTTT